MRLRFTLCMDLVFQERKKKKVENKCTSIDLTKCKCQLFSPFFLRTRKMKTNDFYILILGSAFYFGLPHVVGPLCEVKVHGSYYQKVSLIDN